MSSKPPAAIEWVRPASRSLHTFLRDSLGNKLPMLTNLLLAILLLLRLSVSAGDVPAGRTILHKLFCEINHNGSVLAGYSSSVKSDNMFIAKDFSADDPSIEMHRIISGKCRRI